MASKQSQGCGITPLTRFAPRRAPAKIALSAASSGVLSER